MQRKIGKIFLKTVAGILGLLLLLYLLISLPPVQNGVFRRVVKGVNENLGLNVSVEGIRIVFFNSVRIRGAQIRSQSGDTIVHVSEIGITINPLDLLQQNLHVQRLRLEGADLNFVKHREDSLLNIVKAFSSLPEKETGARKNTGQEFGLHVSRIIASDVALTWSDRVKNTAMTAGLERLEIDTDSLQPGSPLFALEMVEVDELNFRTYSRDGKTMGQKPGQAQLSLTGLHTVVEDVRIGDGCYSASVASLRCRINDGVAIERFTAAALVTGKKASLSEMRLESSAGTIEVLVNADYPSLDRFLADPASAVLSLEFAGQSEPEELASLLERPALLTGYPPVDLAGRITGTADELVLARFSLNAGEALGMRMQGEARHILDPDRLSGQLQIDSIAVYREPLRTYLPDTMLPAGFSPPGRFAVEGMLDGSFSALESDLVFLTDYGDLVSRISLEMDPVSDRRDFKLVLSTEGFDAGRLLEKQDTFGLVAFATTVRGRTYGFKQPAVDLELDVKRFEYLDVTCDSLSLTADYSDNSGNAEAHLVHEYVRVHLAASVSDFDSIPRMQLDLDIDSTSLKELHLTPEPALLRTGLKLDFRGMKWENLAGDLTVAELRYEAGESTYAADSMFVHLESEPGKADYALRIHGAEIGDSVRFDLTNTGQLALTEDSVVNNSILLLRSKQLADSLEYDISFAMLTHQDGLQELDLHLEGAGMLVSTGASLQDAGEERSIDARVDIDSLDLDLFYPFLANRVNALTGYLTGDVRVVGPTNDPSLDGRVVLNEAYINPSILNTGFAIDDQEISFNRSMVRFDGFALTDDLNNRATLDGSVDLDAGTAGGLDVSFTAEEFLLMDKSAASDDPFYGTVRADLDASVTGNTAAPEVSIVVGFDTESDFTFVMPAGDPASGKGIVVFVDEKRGAADRDMAARDMEEISSPQGGLGFTANLNVTDAFTLHLITDPFTGEGLDISGSGDLAFSMNEGGRMTLTGRYEISDGSYELILFDVIRKEFAIEPGSSISWDGDILEATADLSAVYQLETSASNLLRSTRSAGAGDVETYGRIPVEVVMNLSGPLLTPEVDFDIRTGERYQPTAIGSALARLEQNESELNKQVFSLLLLNRFTEEAGAGDPLTYSMKNAARKSLGNLLSQQINKFASRNLEDVDLSLQIESYEQAGEGGPEARTDVSLDVSRSLLNDRLTVRVGGRVAVEESGEEGGQVEAGDLAGNFSVEYKLTPEGTYRLKAFNRTDYEDEIDGEVTKTGISFLFAKEFDDFSNLLSSKEEEGEGEK